MKLIRVKPSPLPPESALWPRVGPQDFLDCFTVRANTTPRVAAEIITDFPRWAQGLLHIRRILVTPFGLSHDGPKATDKVGPFPVESETDQELIAGFNDKHLDFRVSVTAKDGCVSLATWVHVHNAGGRLYLTAILPFHVLIARDALRRVAVATQKIDPRKRTTWT
ncbi:DUF2867 domain-containing protein [uncultured Roseobacter sp.]|uniref:DUF2867 domain-containing protein n=1 Tax=uncultured Roseobacter sp. TaxID=114847 RepID=UPI002617C28E|nr:DUF2867 domain-containing protein [uncultured Roseobacter sp.]